MNDTIVRAVTFPLATPLGLSNERAAEYWLRVNAALASAWALSTSLANWSVIELAKGDVVRGPNDVKIPKMPRVYLYGLWAKHNQRHAWHGATQSANCVMRAVEKKYRATRLQTIWLRRQVLPTYRYPYPFPVHNRSWQPTYGEHGEYLLRVAFPGAGEPETLRLRTGHEFRRQMAGFRDLESGAAKRGEAAIYKSGKHTMAKLVGHFQRQELADREHTMIVRTDPDAFLVAELDGRAPWILNADHVRRWQAEHSRYLQRINEDTKYEKRWPLAVRENINHARDKRCRKQRDRLDSFIHQASAAVVEYARRNRVAEVIFDDQASFIESFPWHSFRTKLAYKLHALGIQLTTREATEVAAT